VYTSSSGRQNCAEGRRNCNKCGNNYIQQVEVIVQKADILGIGGLTVEDWYISESGCNCIAQKVDVICSEGQVACSEDEINYSEGVINYSEGGHNCSEDRANCSAGCRDYL
jgi:hypothetical protein